MCETRALVSAKKSLPAQITAGSDDVIISS